MIKDYKIKNYKISLLENVEIELPFIITFNSEKLLVFSLDNLQLIKKFEIASAELVKIFSCDDQNFTFLIYKENILYFYKNTSIFKRLQIKGIKKLIIKNQTIFLFSNDAIFKVNADFEILSKTMKNWSFSNSSFIGTKEGWIYDYQFNLISEYEKEISYIHDKKTVGFFDGTTSGQSISKSKKIKRTNSCPIIYYDGKNKISANCINNKKSFYDLKSAFPYNKKLVILTNKNEILYDDCIISGNIIITNNCFFQKSFYFVQDKSFRQICFEDGNTITEHSDLIINQDIIIFNNSIIKMKHHKNSFFISDGESILIYLNNEVNVLANEFEISDFDVSNNYIAFANNDGFVYVVKNQNNILFSNKTCLGNESENMSFYTKYPIFDLQVNEITKLNLHAEIVTNLILTQNHIVSSARRKKIRIHDLEGNQIKEIKSNIHSLYKDEKNSNNFIAVSNKKVQFFKDFEFVDEIEYKNEINNCILNGQKITVSDISGNIIFQNIKKSKSNISNILHFLQSDQNMFNKVHNKNGPLHASYHNDSLFITGYFFSHFVKKIKKNTKTVISNLENENCDINYILENNMNINLFEMLKNNKIGGVIVSQKKGIVELNKPFLSLIHKKNRNKYIKYLEKYIFYSKYIEITQILIKELIDENITVRFDMRKIEKWIDNIHREYLGMKLLFKNYQ